MILLRSEVRAFIREALMPTEQITVSTDLDGISLEAYYQIGAETVQVDPSGSYFGADFIGEGSEAFMQVAHLIMKLQVEAHVTYLHKQV